MRLADWGRHLWRRLREELHPRKLARKAVRRDVDMVEDEAFMTHFEACRPYTVTSMERMFALYRATRWVADRGLAGAVVECGVLRGGSVMLAARTLLEAGDDGRDLWLYDTFRGMTEPGPEDESVFGLRPWHRWRRRREGDHNRWGYAPLEEVRRNVEETGYPPERIRYVEGEVEETLPERRPERIALLRLDTDWYASTRHELEHLYPRLVPGGVLIVDDYGHWKGARRAVDEYLEGTAEPTPFLHRIDYTGRLAVKPRGAARDGDDTDGGDPPRRRSDG